MNLINSINRKFKNLSFRRKFIFTLIIPISLASLFIYIYIPAKIENQTYDLISHRIEGISNMTSYAISSALFYEDKENMKETFNIISQDKDILYVIVTDLSNKLIFSYNLKQAEKNGYNNSLNNQISSNISVYKYNNDIVYNNKKVGRLFLGVSLTEINKQISEVRTSIAIISSLCFLISLIVVFGISDFLSKPLEKIVKTIVEISEGDISKRLDYDYHDEIGHLARSFNLMLDYLERTLIELKQSNSKYQTIFESTGTATLIIDVDTTILMANDEYYLLSGYTSSEIIGQKWFQYLAPENLEEMMNYHRQRLKDPVLTPKKIEIKLVNKKNDILDTIMNIGVIPVTNQSIVSILDITIRKQEEKELIRLFEELKLSKIELEKINSEKDKFFSIIAHDLKSPFNGFLNLTKLLADEVHDVTEKERQEFAILMHESAKNLYKLLENLLEWARFQRGVTAYNPEKTMLSLIIKHNLNIQANVANQKEIEFINLIEENTTVTADVLMLNTILRNLISNAIKFTPRGGIIEIGTSEILSKDYDTIYVKDNGIGMSVDILDSLFRVDCKVSRPGTEGELSTGLGLLLCQEFVEKHGGKIWAESEENKGTTFFFTLKS
ncbi:MAG: ATP-binding protein [Bacteroidota bacterium]